MVIGGSSRLATSVPRTGRSWLRGTRGSSSTKIHLVVGEHGHMPVSLLFTAELDQTRLPPLPPSRWLHFAGRAARVGTVNGEASGVAGRMQGHGEAEVWRLLRLVQKVQSRALDFEDAYGLTNSQLSVLSAVVSDAGIDQRRVTATTFVDKSTVAEVITRLVDRRLVFVARSSVDGRRDRLMPTRTAVALLYDATPQLVGRNEAFLAALTGRERAAFLQALQAVGPAGRHAPPSRYVVPSPDGRRPPLDVSWGLGRLLRGSLQRHGRVWFSRVSDITPVQWLALVALVGGDGIDQRTLGDLISLDKASLTVMLERLGRRDLIVKARDPFDGRRRILLLTPSGAETIAGLATQVAAVETDFLAPLEEPQRAGFAHALERLGRSSPGCSDQGQAAGPMSG